VQIGKSFVLTWAALYEQRMGSTEPWLLDKLAVRCEATVCVAAIGERLLPRC